MAPRIGRSGLTISQTGGYGEIYGGERALPEYSCEMLNSAFSIVADGPDAVRKATRHLLHDGLRVHITPDWPVLRGI